MIKEKLKYILWFIAAVVLAIILLPLGFIYTIGKAIYENKGKKILLYLLSVGKEVIKLILELFLRLAIIIDKLGNIVVGELIEDFITDKEDTLFSKHDATISASIGHLSSLGKLNKIGKLLERILNKIFEENHCINSYINKKENDIKK